MPSQSGTYFGATLTYICEHNDDGAMGLMINRDSSLSLIELLSQLHIDRGCVDVDTPVLEGGPVSPEIGFVLHSDDATFSRTTPLHDGLALSAEPDCLTAIAAGEGPKDFLVALGYAGWGPGQLEAEMAANAWLSTDASYEVMFKTPLGDRIDRAAAILGIDFRLMSHHTGHA